MKQKILVVGASIYQVPLIQRVKQLGHTVLSTSYLSKDPGLKIANKGVNVSILDRKALIQLCDRENITAVVTAASDLGALTTGYLNDYFDFSGVSEKQVQAVTDKGRFIRLQEQLDLPRPQSFLITKQEEYKRIIPFIKKWPVIVKPIFASGSRGVQIIHAPQEAEEALKFASETSELRQHCVLQTYIEGQEHGAECFVEYGKVVFLELTSKFSNNNRVPLGHCVPCEVNEIFKTKLIQQIECIVEYLEVKNSAINIDVIVESNNRPIIIDFSFRLGGNLLSQLMSSRFNIDSYERIIEYATKEKIKPIQTTTESQNFFGSIILGSPTISTLTESWKTDIKCAAKKYATVIEIIFDLKTGEKIELFDQSSNRFGHILVSVDTLQQYSRLLNEIESIALNHTTIGEG